VPELLDRLARLSRKAACTVVRRREIRPGPSSRFNCSGGGGFCRVALSASRAFEVIVPSPGRAVSCRWNRSERSAVSFFLSRRLCPAGTGAAGLSAFVAARRAASGVFPAQFPVQQPHQKDEGCDDDDLRDDFLHGLAMIGIKKRGFLSDRRAATITMRNWSNRVRTARPISFPPPFVWP